MATLKKTLLTLNKINVDQWSVLTFELASEAKWQQMQSTHKEVTAVKVQNSRAQFIQWIKADLIFELSSIGLPISAVMLSCNNVNVCLSLKTELS